MFIADLHIHSRFSLACSKGCDIEHLSWWARRKGVTVVGTGGFTHPAWAAELKHTLTEAEPGCYLVPAHVWTPWFAVLGSKSGFDAVRDCYAGLAGHIFAVETGLSSDPAMNWTCSALDGYRLVSNSDAHSPPMLGREARCSAPSWTTSRWPRRCAPAGAWPGRWSSSPRRARTTWTGTASAASGSSPGRPPRWRAGARPAASR
jgi:PHP family Zn ribbon phosphoesterase